MEIAVLPGALTASSFPALGREDSAVRQSAGMTQTYI